MKDPDISPNDGADIDPQETKEWLDALQSVIETDGVERAHFIMQELLFRGRRSGVTIPYNANTPYLNTIPPERQQPIPGDAGLERKLRSLMRWNAMAMVARANLESAELGGHIASYASAATLYETGFNHFFHAPSESHGGDMVFFQGHSAPGIYARAFLEGRLSEAQLDNFRQELAPGGGLSSYPHPWLMSDFWQFPTVSMGLGPIMAIYQARFMSYLHHRGFIDMQDRKIWAFMGDGEMDEPESQGAIALASREKLDNLIFVVNCNLQRLDGPVRGNGKIIQELEANFRGAGWNVIKLVWGSQWDDLLARDKTGLLVKRMAEAVDGEYQNYKAKGGAYTREHFFGKYPDLLKLVSHLSDEDIARLSRGGHDPHKVYAAFHEAVTHTGRPTVLLVKTIKGYGMGQSGEAQNVTHSKKKLGWDDLRVFRDRFDVPVDDEDIEQIPYCKPADDSPEMVYMRERRAQLGGDMPVRHTKAPALQAPELEAFATYLKSTEKREISTTMAYVRMLTMLCKDKTIGKHIVPIVPDEARTFGMDGLFRQLGIYAYEGQLYEPMDSDQFLYYREDTNGQILQEGISEAGGMSSWIAAGTAYSCHGVSMIPFYTFYSMFGFQRVGDLAWAAADMQTRGFLVGGTAGRTTLAGEGLQHQDGHSHLMAAAIPTCQPYDPTYAYELAVIIQDGLRRMVQEQENIFYYITVENENYTHPDMPEGVEPGILKGLYLLQAGAKSKSKPRVQLLGCGSILREVRAAAEILEAEFSVLSDVWSATSFTLLARDGVDVERWNRLHPNEPQRTPYVTELLQNQRGPVVAASDYVRLYAEQIRAYVPQPYTVLGTDGFGRSETRRELRAFFEVDAHSIVVAALSALAADGSVERAVVQQAIEQFGIDPDTPNPITR